MKGNTIIICYKKAAVNIVITYAAMRNYVIFLCHTIFLDNIQDRKLLLDRKQSADLIADSRSYF
jgi:hypothetical protein